LTKAGEDTKGDGGVQEADRDKQQGNGGEQCAAQAYLGHQQCFFDMSAARSCWFIKQGVCW